MKFVIKGPKLCWPNGDFALRSIGQGFTHYFYSKISPEKDTQESESSGIKRKYVDSCLRKILLVN